MKKQPRHFLTLADYSPREILGLLDLAAKVKKSPRAYRRSLEGQCLALIFEKSSTRTRVSFEAGMFQLGGHALFLNKQDLQLGKSETTADTARVLSRFVQGIMIRTFAQSTVEELARYASVPVINGLSDSHHPCQVLADLQTLREKRGRLKGKRLVFVGDGNNVAQSLMIGCAKLGMRFKLVCPQNYGPDPAILAYSEKEAARNGGAVEVCRKAAGAARDADAVYTDVWTSMGQETEKARRLADFAGYQVDEALMKEAPGAVFLHCLPAHRGEEVSAGVMDGGQSAVWDEAENRLHAQKALLVTLMGKKKG
jgi:ornithine carbamoyltransferase